MKLFTVDEASQILRLSKASVYGLVHRRLIGFRKHGSRVVFTEEHLHDFSAAGEVLPVTKSTLGKLSHSDNKVILRNHGRQMPPGSLTTKHSKRPPPTLTTEHVDGNQN